MKNTISTFCSIILFLCTSYADTNKVITIDESGDEFILYISNQSFEITPIDIEVKIDGIEVAKGKFEVEIQHTYTPFKCSLNKGKHKISVISKKEGVKLEKDFELTDHDIGVVEFWYYPETDYNATPRAFSFNTYKGPLLID